MLLLSHPEHRNVTPGTRQVTLFTERPSDKLCMNLVALDREKRGLVTGMLSDHCTQIMGLLESVMCKKCAENKESS
jgi:hypothetical protein